MPSLIALPQPPAASRSRQRGDDYDDQPAERYVAAAVEHRCHIPQRGVRHEEKSQQRPEPGVEHLGEPVREEVNNNHHDTRHQQSKQHEQARHLSLLSRFTGAKW
jgi:hypothetical protein